MPFISYTIERVDEKAEDTTHDSFHHLQRFIVFIGRHGYNQYKIIKFPRTGNTGNITYSCEVKTSCKQISRTISWSPQKAVL